MSEDAIWIRDLGYALGTWLIVGSDPPSTDKIPFEVAVALTGAGDQADFFAAVYARLTNLDSVLRIAEHLSVEVQVRIAQHAGELAARAVRATRPPDAAALLAALEFGDRQLRLATYLHEPEDEYLAWERLWQMDVFEMRKRDHNAKLYHRYTAAQLATQATVMACGALSTARLAQSLGTPKQFALGDAALAIDWALVALHPRRRYDANVAELARQAAWIQREVATPALVAAMIRERLR